MKDSDLVTELFGPFGRMEQPDFLNLSTGSLVGVPFLKLVNRAMELAGVTESLNEYPGTQGSERLLACFSRISQLEGTGTVAPHRFIATHGALDALGHALHSSGASRVVFPSPGFAVFLAAERMGIPTQPVHWPIGSRVSELIERIGDQLRTNSGRAAVVVNFPANPHGVSPSPDEWRSLVELTDRWGAVLILDDVYRFTEDPSARPHTEAEHVIRVDSVSKRLGVPGLRLGYLTTSGRLFDGARMSMGRTSVGVSNAVAALAVAALDAYCGDLRTPNAVREELARRRMTFRHHLSADLGSRLVLADSGLYGCLMLDSESQEEWVCRELLSVSVRVTPGRGLWPPGCNATQSFIRFCIGSTVDWKPVAERINQVFA